MGWRADRAYGEAEKEAYHKWRASLTRTEYLQWQWARWRHFVAGAATAGSWGLVFWWLFE